jgi:hypothetical protein
MGQMLPRPESQRRGGSAPVVIVAGLVIAVWISAAIPVRPTARPREAAVPPPPSITTGDIQSLSAEMDAAPRALVYVDAPWSSYAVRGRGQFRAAAAELAAARLGVRFFLVSDEGDPGVKEWVARLGECRLFPLAVPIGYGGMVWLEAGRAADADARGGTDLTSAEMVARTHSLWGAEAEPVPPPERAGNK